MCRFDEITHTYAGCKLVEKKQDDTPTAQATFLGALTNLNPFANHNAPGENAPPITNEQGLHIITEKRIMQCSDALNDPAQRREPAEKRRCKTLKPLKPEEGEPVVLEVTKHKGVCEACLAGEEAIRAALRKERIYPTNVPMRPVSRGQGSKKKSKHVHHSAIGTKTEYKKPKQNKGGNCHIM